MGARLVARKNGPFLMDGSVARFARLQSRSSFTWGLRPRLYACACFARFLCKASERWVEIETNYRQSGCPQLQLVSLPPAAFRQCRLQYSSPVGAGHLHGSCAHVSVFSALFIASSSPNRRRAHGAALRVWGKALIFAFLVEFGFFIGQCQCQTSSTGYWYTT